MWPLPELVDHALRAHPTLSSARAAEAAAVAGSRAAKMQYLPRLNLSASLASGFVRRINDTNYLLDQARGNAAGRVENCQFWNTLASGLSTSLPGYPDNDCGRFAYNDEMQRNVLAQNDRFPFDYESTPMFLSLGITLPIVDGFTRERTVQTARAAADDAKYQRRAEELARRAEVTASYNALLTAYRTVGLEARNAETAAEQLRLARERYRLGAGSIVELSQAQEQAVRADQSHLDALYSFHENLAALEAAVGRQLR
jgi:outer membrane protein TolC